MFDLDKNYCNENCSKTELLKRTRATGVDFCNRRRRGVFGFTLVELLVVVAIIGILATLITAAAFRVIATTRVTTVRMKIGELEQALELYKNKFGEYPPMLNDAPAVARHIKKRWPRCSVTSIPTTTKDSLVFWLGGFQNEDGKYCGFGVDKANPFGVTEGVGSGAYDNEVFIELIHGTNVKPDPDDGKIRVVISMGGKDYPVVYFRGRKGGGEDAYKHKYKDNDNNDVTEIWQETTSCGIASPYWKDSGKWHNPETFQLIHTGIDGEFFRFPETVTTDAAKKTYFDDYKNRRITNGSELNDHDYDNITNLGTSTIETLLP